MGLYFRVLGSRRAPKLPLEELEAEKPYAPVPPS